MANKNTDLQTAAAELAAVGVAANSRTATGHIAVEQKTAAKRARAVKRPQQPQRSAKSKAAQQIERANRRQSRFPYASMGIIIWLTLVWVMLWGELNTKNFVSGFLLALLITTVAPFPVTPFDGRFRPWGVVRLVVIFFADIVKASFMQARFILRGKHPHGAIIRVQLRSHSDIYLAMVSGMTGLVPGSVVVDVHRATGMLYVHVFDTSLAGGIDGIHRTVLEQEERVLRAFGSHDELIDAGYVPGSRPSAGRLPTPYAPATGPALVQYGVRSLSVTMQDTVGILDRIAGNRLQGEIATDRDQSAQGVS